MSIKVKLRNGEAAIIFHKNGTTEITSPGPIVGNVSSGTKLALAIVAIIQRWDDDELRKLMRKPMLRVLELQKIEEGEECGHA